MIDARNAAPSLMVKENSKMLSNSSWRVDVFIVFVLFVVAFFVEGFDPHVRLADLQDPSLNFPHIPDIVPSRYLLLGSFIVPVAVFLVLHLKSLRTISAPFAVFVLGLFESHIITVLITNILKLLVGRPRPYFAVVCEEYAPNAHNLCTGSAHAVAEARKSFPSGHSSLAFSAGTYVAIYLAFTLRVSNAHVSAKTGRLVIVLLPLMAAALVAVSRTIDYHHHFADVAVGSGLGAALAALVWWSRWDQLEKGGMGLPLADVGGSYDAIGVESVV